MELRVRGIEGRPDVAVVEVTGEVDSMHAELFRERLVSLVTGPIRHLIVNLADLTYINSSGLGALVAAYRRVRALDGSVKICSARGSITEVIKLIRLDKIIDVYDSEDTVLASLGCDAPAGPDA